MDGNQSDDNKMARAASARPDHCFASLLRYRHARLVRVPAPNCDGEGKPDPPVHDSVSSQPAVDFHAELKRNLDHVTAQSDLELCDPQRLKLLDDLADDEDVLEPDPLHIQGVDSTSVAESLSDPFDDYIPGCAIEQKPSSSAGEANRATSMPDLSAEKIAYLFAEQAASKLDMVDFHHLLDFLNREPQSGDLEALKQLTRKGVETFYESELKLSGGARDRLTRPSGPENADLGLVLHVASKEDEIEGFWDVESRTIQLLIQKGVGDQNDFVFAFDWHWRAEGKRSKRKGLCPTTTWSRKLRLLHNTFSATLLEQLELPLLIIAGACPVRQYWNTLPPTARHVELKIAIPDSPGSDAKIAFHLDFRDGGLKRIVACVDHPSAVFFRRQHYHINIRLDAVFNYFLWLNGGNYDKTTFTGRKRGESEGLRFAEPWKEVHEYNKKERTLGRHLAQSEYEQSFLLWAKGYLKEDPAALLARGDSFVARVDQNFKKTVRLALAKRFGHEYAEYWHNKEPKISVATGPATIKLYVDPEKPALQFKGPWELGALVNVSQLDLIIKFREDHVALSLGSRKVFSRSRQSLTGSGAQAKEWEQQFDKELRQSRQVPKDLEKQGSPESSSAKCVRHAQSLATEVWMATRSRGKHKHLHLCIRSKHLIGKYSDIERWDGTCRTGCILQEEQDIDHSRVPDEESKEQAKTQSKGSNDRLDYYKAYYEANKEEKQAKNRAYQERNKADLNEKAKARMRALRQHRKHALQRDATTADGIDVDE